MDASVTVKSIYKYIFLCFIASVFTKLVSGQIDSSNNQLKFDFGLIRDKNRHLWPIVYKHKTKDYKDLQLLFTLYRNYQSYKEPYKHNHFLPFYWYDSSTALKDIRVGTLFYPNLFRTISDTATKSKSYRFFELAPEISFLNITKSKTGLLTQNNLFFFIWSKNDVLKQKSNLVVFPFYWYYKNQYRTTNTLFPLYRYVQINDRNEKNFSFYPSLYFYKKEKQTVRHSALLLFYHKKYGQDSTATLGSKTVLFPLLFANSNNRFKTFTLFPLIYFDKTVGKQEFNSHLAVTPLFWRTQTNQFTSNILFPLYWQNKSIYPNDSSRSTLLLPIYYSYVSALNKKKYYIPLVWYKRSISDTSLTVFPLFYSQKSLYNSYHTLLPFYYYQNNKNTQTQTLAITPLYWHSKRLYNSSNILFPLYWQNKNMYTGDSSRSTLLLPIYYSYVNALDKKKYYMPFIWYKRSISDTSLTIFPLFYGQRSLYNSYHTLLPFYYYQNNKNTQTQTLAITPIFWKTKGPDNSSSLLFPLWYKYKLMNNTDSVFIQNFIPFVFYQSINQSKRFTFFPLYYHKNDGLGGNYQFIFPNYLAIKNNYSRFKSFLPVYFYNKNRDAKFHLLLPIWYNKHLYKTDDVVKSNLILPLYFSYKNKAEKVKILLPLIYKSETNFKNWQGKILGITPFYWNTFLNDSEALLTRKTQTLFPIWWYNKSITNGTPSISNTIFPIYFSNSSLQYAHKVLFPLFWHYRDSNYRNTTIFPIYHRYALMDKSYTLNAYTPFVWRVTGFNVNKYYIFPFVWYDKHAIKNDTTLNTIIFPFYWNHKNAKDYNTVLFPIYWQYKNQERKSISILPIYFYKLSGDDSNATKKTVVFPIWYQTENRLSKKTVILPLYFRYKTPTDTNTVILPLWYHFKNRIRITQLLFPFYFMDKRDGYTTKAITPIYWQTNTPAYSQYTLFPFWWSKTDSLLKYHLLIPFYYKDKHADGSSLTGITPLFWHSKWGNYSQYTLFPLWWSKTDSLYKYRLLIPFYYRDKNADGSTLTGITPLFWHSKWGNYSQYTLFPLWWSKTDSLYKYRLLIPFYYRDKNVDGSTLTGITPLFWHSKRGDYVKYTLFPLWWSKKDSLQTSNTLFPLWHVQKSKNGLHQLLGITPLYWYYKNDTLSSSTLFPLWFQNKETGINAYQSNFILPLVYTYSSKKVNKLHVFPLFFSSKSANNQSALFIPLYFHDVKRSKNTSETYVTRRTMLTPLVWINKDSTYTQNLSSTQFNRFRIIPLYWHKHRFGNNSSKTSNTLFPLYFDVTEKSNQQTLTKKQVLFPIIWYFKHYGSKSFTFFPLYHFDKKGIEHHLAITPLFWHIKNDKKTQHFIWPLYAHNKQLNNTRFHIAYLLYRYQKTDKIKSWSALWPLVQRIKGNKYSYFHLAPFVWYKKSDSMNYFSIQPLFFSQRTNATKRFQILWQLYSYRKTFDVKTSNSFLWRSFYTDTYTNGDYETRLFYKVFAHVKKDSSSENTLLPFYDIKKTKNGDYAKAYLLNMYAKTKTQVPNTNYYYMEEKIFWYIRLRSNFNYLKQKGIIKDRKFMQ